MYYQNVWTMQKILSDDRMQVSDATVTVSFSSERFSKRVALKGEFFCPMQIYFLHQEPGQSFLEVQNSSILGLNIFATTWRYNALTPLPLLTS